MVTNDGCDLSDVIFSSVFGVEKKVVFSSDPGTKDITERQKPAWPREIVFGVENKVLFTPKTNEGLAKRD